MGLADPGGRRVHRRVAGDVGDDGRGLGLAPVGADLLDGRLPPVAGPGRPGDRPRPRVRTGVRLPLDSMERTQAFVLDQRMDVPACNTLAAAVLGHSRTGPEGRSIPRHVFLDPGPHDFHPERSAVAVRVAYPRMPAGHPPGRPPADRARRGTLAEERRPPPALGRSSGPGVRVREEADPAPGRGAAELPVRDAGGLGGPGPVPVGSTPLRRAPRRRSGCGSWAAGGRRAAPVRTSPWSGPAADTTQGLSGGQALSRLKLARGPPHPRYRGAGRRRSPRGTRAGSGRACASVASVEVREPLRRSVTPFWCRWGGEPLPPCRHP